MMIFSKMFFRLSILILLLLPIDTSAQNVSWLVKPKYDAISTFSEGVATIKLNGKWGYVNEQGKEIVKPEYEVAYPFSDCVGVLGTADKTVVAIADLQGKIIKPQSPFKIDDRFAQFSDGLLLVSNGKKWGYMNKSGSLSIGCKYISSQPFSEGLAAVKFDYDGGFYYIGTDGSTYIEPNPELYWALGFDNGKALILYKNGIRCIDRKGKEITNNFPKLTPPDEALYYKQPSLSFKEGELLFDSKCRAIAFVDKTGKRTDLSESPQQKNAISVPQGYFELNGKRLTFDDHSLGWITTSMATVKAANGKYGILALSEKPTFQISVKHDTLKSFFGSEAKSNIDIYNMSARPANDITVIINNQKTEDFSSIESMGKRELSFTVIKESDSVDNKYVDVSIVDNGLLLLNARLAVTVKDIPSIEIDIPVKNQEVCLTDKHYIHVKLKNTADRKAENINVTLNNLQQNVSIDALSEKMLTYEVQPSITTAEVKVKPPHSSLISKKYNVSFTIIKCPTEMNPGEKHIDPGEKKI